MILGVVWASCWGQNQSVSRPFTVVSATHRTPGLHIVINPKQPHISIDQYLELLCQLRGFDLASLPQEPKLHKKPEDYSFVIVEFYLTRSSPPNPFTLDDPDLVAAIRWMPWVRKISWVKGPAGIKVDWVSEPCIDPAINLDDAADWRLRGSELCFHPYPLPRRRVTKRVRPS